jgi:cytochrome c-type biogenesis protein CcmE
VAQGRLGDDGVFVADTVLARCASRFEAEWEEA